MRDEIWYREELVCLRDLVLYAIGSGVAGRDEMKQVALGGLFRKLEVAIASAPSARTPESAA